MKQTYSLTTVYRCTRLHNLPYNLLALPSVPLSWLLLNHTRLSANATSVMAGTCGLAGVFLFAMGQPAWAALGLLLFFELDCCDGTIARARNQVSLLGGRLDLAIDRLVLFAFALTLMAIDLQAARPLVAWMVPGYLILHYVTDLMWIMKLQGQIDQRGPKSAVSPQGSMPAYARLPRILRVLLHLESAVRPDVWVCNALFLLGPCLFPDHRLLTAIVPLAALGWTLCVCAVYAILVRR
jgi:phosphatidylglycerophosphate synthase